MTNDAIEDRVIRMKSVFLMIRFYLMMSKKKLKVANSADSVNDGVPLNS
jgi:hypothetical protein